MNLSVHVWSTALTATAMVVFPLGASAADETPAPQNMQQRVFFFENGQAMSVAGVVDSLFPDCRIGVEEQSNSLVVSCPPNLVEQVSELAKTLDRPRSHMLEHEYFHGDFVTPTLKTLLRTAMSRAAKVAVDPRAQVVAVAGTPRDLAEARRLITVLDESGRGDQADGTELSQLYHLELYFISAQYDDRPGESHLPPLPSPLKPVGEALAEQGLHQPRLLAALVVLTRPQQAFELTGTVRRLSASDEADAPRVIVEAGGHSEATGPNSMRLGISAKLVQTAPGLGGENSEELFEVQTDVICAVDDYVRTSAGDMQNQGDGIEPTGVSR